LSDDTPTQRFDQPEAPTELLTPPPAGPGGTPPAASGDARSKRTIIILSIIGGVLLLALIGILVFLLATRGSGTGPAPSDSPTPSASASASASATPSASPTPTPTPTPTQTTAPEPPPQAGPAFTDFVSPSSIGGCSAGGPGFDPFKPEIKVAWATTHAVSVWYVNGTDDAADSRFMEIPLTGDQSDFEFPQTMQCNQQKTVFTLTLVGDDGSHVSKTWTIKNTGEIVP